MNTAPTTGICDSGPETQLFVEGVAVSDEVADQQIQIEVDPAAGNPNSGVTSDTVQVTVVDVDLDVDSRNDASLGSQSSDLAEDIILSPGMWIQQNLRDHDHDRVPGFADGLTGLSESQDKEFGNIGEFDYAKMTLSLPTPIDPARAEVRFLGVTDNDPSTTVGPSDPNSDSYKLPPGQERNLRVWTEEAFRFPGQIFEVFRNSRIANHASHDKWVKGYEWIPAQQLGFFDDTREMTFYIEGIMPSRSRGDQRIIVQVRPNFDESDVVVEDIVSMTVVDVDLDIGTTTVYGSLFPWNDLTDQAEEYGSGENIMVNDGDRDGDSVLDFRDGFDGGVAGDQGVTNTANGGVDASPQFTPLYVELSEAVDVAKAELTFVYDAAYPELWTMNGAQPVPTGAMRIWVKDGDRPRTVGLVQSGGDFIDVNVPIPASLLGFTDTCRYVILYVEGTRNSVASSASLFDSPLSMRGSEIKVLVDPDGSGPSSFLADDVVKATVTTSEAIAGKIEYAANLTTEQRAPLRYAKVEFLNSIPGGGETPYETYTNADGEFFIHLNDAVQDWANSELHVYATSDPSGNKGVWYPDPSIPNPVVQRTVSVVDPRWVDELFEWTIDLTQFAPPATLLPTAFIDATGANAIGAGEVPTSFNNKALWIFDAAVTAELYHKTLPGIAPGHVTYEFRQTGAISTEPPGNTINYAEGRANHWDDIIHEYGHAVAMQNGFDRNTEESAKHRALINSRAELPGESHEHHKQLSFSEGWASYYSMVAQEEVPVAPLTGFQIGGEKYNNEYLTESASHLKDSPRDGRGEDEEMTVMRVLWDLYDPANEPEDQVELGSSAVFLAVKAIGSSGPTLDGLWDHLWTDAMGTPQAIVDYGASHEPIVDYGAILEANHVSPSLAHMELAAATGTPIEAWRRSDGIPSFVFDIPRGNSARTGGQEDPADDAGQLLDQFELIFLDDDYELLFKLQFSPGDCQVDDDRATYTLTSGQADELGTYFYDCIYWVVSGEWSAADPIGPYWSGARSFSVKLPE